MLNFRSSDEVYLVMMNALLQEKPKELGLPDVENNGDEVMIDTTKQTLKPVLGLEHAMQTLKELWRNLHSDPAVRTEYDELQFELLEKQR